MRRGEIWWAWMGAPRGSEPGYRRPVMVISANTFNTSNIATVLCAVVTRNLALATAPGNVRIGPKDSGLPRESVINVSQVVTLDKRYLDEVAGVVPRRQLRSVEAGLRLVLAL